MQQFSGLSGKQSQPRGSGSRSGARGLRFTGACAAVAGAGRRWPERGGFRYNEHVSTQEDTDAYWVL